MQRELLAIFWITLDIYSLITADRYVCPGGVEYVAQSMSSGQSKDFLFYGTQQDIDSAAQCAKFCYETEFCRSAAYNPKERTCDLAYANVMRCQDSGPAERTRASHATDQITAIFCIQCPGGKISVDKIDDKHYQSSIQSTTAVVNSSDSSDNGVARSLGTNSNRFGSAGGACFVEYEQKVLLRASYAVEKNLKLDECKCKCANSWAVPSTSTARCRSFQYFPDRNECVLNSIARPATSSSRFENTSDFTDITSQRTSYYDFTCQEASAVAELTAGYCSKFLPIKGLAIISPSISAPVIDISTSPNDTSACFEQIEGHMLTGVAGGLEHDVTLDRCRCVCATSSSLGKYDFVCKSIMYYQSERDCVLNLEDRLNRPDLFRLASESENRGNRDYAVTYVGLTCQGDAIKKYVDTQCRQSKSSLEAVNRGDTTTAVSILEASIKVENGKSPNSIPPGPLPAPGDKTDECFVEINEYVLSDMASAIEADVTMDECKCLCADSVSRHGVICLSIQYYADVKTCLMNRKNRIQEPNNFKKVVSSMPHTYLDYLCSDVGAKKESYWQKKCIPLKLPQQVIGRNYPTAILGSADNSASANSSKSNPGTTTPHSSLPTFSPSSPLPTPSIWSPTHLLTRTLNFNTATPNKIHLDSSTALTRAPSSTGQPGISPPVATGFGPCHYSAFYETEFNGRRMIERIVVGDPLVCFQNCAQKHCKSANILNFLGRYKYCELFLDSSVDYPHTNLISYNVASVYFDGIQCERL